MATNLWKRYRDHLCSCPLIGLSLDISRMNFPDGFLKQMEPGIKRAYEAMDKLEGGAIANPDEKRMVGHYWLRAARLAPDEQTTKQIVDALAQVHTVTGGVHAGRLKPQRA